MRNDTNNLASDLISDELKVNVENREAPMIAPRMAELLQFSLESDVKITPRDINHALNEILNGYDSLTEEYRENRQRIESELQLLQKNSDGLSDNLHQLDEKVQTQELEINQTQSTIHSSIKQLSQKNTQEFAIASGKFRGLDEDINALNSIAKRQESILAELDERLDQFNLAQRLLSTHTRANRQRIESVQTETKRQQNLQELRIEGLKALQSNQQTAIKTTQSNITELQQQTKFLDGSLIILNRDLEHHAKGTKKNFHFTSAAIVFALLLIVAGFASVKWWPAFIPVNLIATDEKVNQLVHDVSVIPQVQNQTEKLSVQASNLENTVGDIASNLTDLKYEILGPGVLTTKTLTPVLPLNDMTWLMNQDPNAYTVQMLGVYSYDDMAIYINENSSSLKNSQLSYTKTARGQREWFNLFAGVYPDFDSALDAIAKLPVQLRKNKPWIRTLSDVQTSAN